VAFARPLTVAESVVRPVWLDTVEPKFDTLDTRILYDVPPVTVLQLKVGEVAWLVALSVGETSVGAPDVATIVVKLQMLDHAPVPSAFVAFTSQ
jgi:hypothetical protein